MASDNHTAQAFPAALNGKNMKQRASLPDRLWKALVWFTMVFFLLNVLLLIATVAVNSVATRWFGTLLPQGFTLHWYGQAWSDFQLTSVLWVTIHEITHAVQFTGAPWLRAHLGGMIKELIDGLQVSLAGGSAEDDQDKSDENSTPSWRRMRRRLGWGLPRMSSFARPCAQ